MKVMHTNVILKGLVASVLSTALLGAAVAQQEPFPREREQAQSCAEVDWNKDMIRNHPRLTEACREVVTSSGMNWARFEAKFARVEPDGRVSFSIRDRRDRSIEEVILQPAVGQVAYINNRATPFSQLSRDQLVNLYVPEGQYGFVTQPGAPLEQIAVVTAPAPAAAAAPATTRVAVAQPRAATLPATAGPLPWFALGGILSLLGAGGLRLGRRR
ncbi:MAG: hypothetical protein ACNA8J_07175 [Gammaproteobacteria bacterium]